jgi:hypothetical protein
MDKVNYKHTAFVLIKPPSRVISYHLIKTTAEHQQLIDKAIESGQCLYSAPITKKNGKYVATQPWQLETDTIPNEILQPAKDDIAPETPTQDEPDGLYCPFCKKTMASTSGRTLHVKSSHPDQLQEYQTWLKSLGKTSSKKQKSS